MLNVLWEIVKNPVMYIFAYFLTGLEEHVINVFISALMLSIAAIPFYFIGNFIFKKIKGGQFKKVVLTSFFTAIISSVIISIWNYLFNDNYLGFFENGIFPIILGLISLTVILFIIIEIGLKIHKFMVEHWEMPKALQQYIIIFTCCFIFFSIWAIYLFISELI